MPFTKRARLLLLSILGCLLLSTGVVPFAGRFSPQLFGSTPAIAQENQVYVHCNLISNCKKIVPGKKFRLGVELNMDPGWHTYYKISGDAGMASKIEWQLPEGFKVGKLMWQMPHKFTDSGIVTYGYSDYTLISAEVEPPANLKEGSSLDLKAKVKWLSCKDICVPGNQIVELKMPVASPASALEEQNQAKFAKSNYDGPVEGIKEDNSHGAPKADGSGSNPPGSGSASSSSTSSSAGTSLTSSSDSESSSKSESSSTSSSRSDSSSSGTSEASSTSSSTSELTSSSPASSAGGGNELLAANYKVTGGDDGKAGLLAYLGFAFIGGFILNFMPCVLPVISIKVFSLIKQAGDHPEKIFQHGITFMAGILLSFISLGGLVIAIQGAGQKVGWGFQFQYPIFVLGMACIVTLFALSMFGVFLVNVTAGQQQIDKLASSEGLTGTFFKGVLATVLSTPCTAPFLGTALGFAFAQPWWEILTVFFVIGLGMSSPYLVLALKPEWMKFLPKPGTWMERFKESMGFLLLATAVWLLWVLTNQVGIDAGMAAVAFLVCLSLAAWIVGSFLDLTSTVSRRVMVWSISLGVVAAGAGSFLMPFPALLSTKPATSKASDLARGEGAIKWENFSLASLDKELKANKTVFIDFTADWCLTCKANEQAVINTQPVIDKLKQLNVLTMKADWTAQDPEISDLLHKFGRSGVPAYVIYPAGKPNEPILLPEVISQSLVIENLDKAGASKAQ